MEEHCNREIFQYISCYGLSEYRRHVGQAGSISIHLMLRFINIIVVGFNSILLFQYISCYGLSTVGKRYLSTHTYISIHLMLRFILSKSGYIYVLDSFQYISCYGLSIPQGKMKVTVIWFQYISCYGLSAAVELVLRRKC